MSIETLQRIIESGTKLTPMMEQYFTIKKQNPGILLLFRMGDFYELFFDDAVAASKILNITLTHRGKLGETPIPMAGIPHHAAATYIDRITARGLKAAICEQIEDPKDAVGIVKRAVTQIVSPGMPFDLEKTDSAHHFICSAIHMNGNFYLANIDFTTGQFEGHKLKNATDLMEQIRLLSPKEFILHMGQWEEFPLIEKCLNSSEVLKTHLGMEYFNPQYTQLYTEKLIPGFERDKIIALDPEILAPIGALAYYVGSTQKMESFSHIRPFQMIAQDGIMKTTLPTLRGLEILPKNHDDYKNSLLGFFDKTKTAMGRRELKTLFITPLTDLEQISQRQELVAYFIDNSEALITLREILDEIRDIERIMAKVTSKKVTPGDLINLGNAINQHQKIISSLPQIPQKIIPQFVVEEINTLAEISNTISSAINDQIGASLEKGNLIKSKYNRERDRLAALGKNATQALLELEEDYRNKTNIPKLRIKYNNVTGYFIEITKSYSDKVPADFVRRQTLVNSERYSTPRLAEFEKEVITAKEKLFQLERQLFNEMAELVSNNAQLLLKLSRALGLLDAFQSFAWIGRQEGLVCPQFLENKKIIRIQGGWHPLIKTILRDEFICHDLELNEECYFGLITGPNMAGKTTVMREVAIIQHLAQLGSFVPASKVTLSICDHLFSRLGASDDILRGQSTFMVEMSETAEILRHATERSLIILDEVGRGTSTYDGLSIAWALVEHLVQKTRSLGLFATHYHELIDLIGELEGAKNLTVETKNIDDEVQFLYRLVEKPAEQSFGIYVAKLAGVPHSILKRSAEVLRSLEEDKNKHKIPHQQLSLPLQVEMEIPAHLKDLEDKLMKLDILNLTPMAAINKLHELKQAITSP